MAASTVANILKDAAAFQTWPHFQGNDIFSDFNTNLVVSKIDVSFQLIFKRR